MAVSFTEEALRIMQDAVSIHEAIQPGHARKAADSSLHPASYSTYLPTATDMVSCVTRRFCLAILVALEYEIRVLGPFLDR